jgi:hypothetical protein
VFPPHEQEMVRVRLSENLVAVVSQRLLPRKDGVGRVVAAEVMIVTATIRDAILDRRRSSRSRTSWRRVASSTARRRSTSTSWNWSRTTWSRSRSRRRRHEPGDFELKMRTLA